MAADVPEVAWGRGREAAEGPVGLVIRRRADAWSFSWDRVSYAAIPGLSVKLNFKGERVVKITSGGHGNSEGRPMAVAPLVNGKPVDYMGTPMGSPEFAGCEGSQTSCSFYGYGHAYPTNWMELTSERVVKVSAGLHEFQVGLCGFGGSASLNGGWMQVEVLPVGYEADGPVIDANVRVV